MAPIAALDAFVISSALPLLLLVFGLLIGSFLNVVIYRLPREQSLISPGSRCPACASPIRPWHNIPVVSWILLRGRCARCQSPISSRYPAVEATTGLLFVAAGLLDGLSVALPFHLAFLAALVAVAFIDLDFQIIPDEISLPGALLGLICAALSGRFVDGLLGALLGSGLLWGLGAAYYALRKVEGMGGGDVKLAAMLGAFLGWKGILLTLFVASFFGAAAGIVLIRIAGGGRQTRIPFGTFLAPAAALVLLTGTPVIAWYAGLLAR